MKAGVKMHLYINHIRPKKWKLLGRWQPVIEKSVQVLVARRKMYFKISN